MEPVLLGDVAFRDRDEAGQPRLGCEQVIERGIEPRAAELIGEPIADRKQLALPVVEETEVHFVEVGRGAVGERRHSRRAGAAGIIVGLALGQLVEARPRASAARRRSCRCRPSRRICGSSGIRVCVSYQLSRWPSKCSRRSIVVSVASSAGDERIGVDEPEVVRRHRREQAHRDVGRRRAVRDARLGIELHVVRRQPAIVRADERLEVLPGRARDGLEIGAIVGGELRPGGRRGLAELIGDERRDRPEHQDRQRRRQALRPHDDDQP